MFRTPVNIPDSKNKIDFESEILTMGSCFAENIGKKFQESYFNILVNPFGILFNPSSISKNLRQIISGNLFTNEHLFENNKIWNSFSHSTLFSKENREDALQLINSSIQNAHSALKSADYLLITFGTSWVFELNQTSEIVANCHKLPASAFSRRKLTIEEIYVDYQSLINELIVFNPTIKIIFTVSPVRHLKDGAYENNLSKSTLLLVVESLIKEFENIMYFPAYEIQMDELRDYRFYADDMCHPSNLAIEYIWKKFTDTYFEQGTMNIIKEIGNYNSRKNHHLLHPDTLESQVFVQNTKHLKSKLISTYPFLESRI